MKTLPYRVGDWVAVQLRRGGWAVAVVAEARGSEVAVHIFEPAHEWPPQITGPPRVGPPALSVWCHDLFLADGRWPVRHRPEIPDSWPEVPYDPARVLAPRGVEVRASLVLA